MLEHDREVASVRGRAERDLAPGVNVTRIKIRVDFFPHAGELDYSFIAWHHPHAVLIRNELWSHYDRHHVGMAAQDIVAEIYSAIRATPDPFPAQEPLRRET